MSQNKTIIPGARVNRDVARPLQSPETKRVQSPQPDPLANVYRQSAESQARSNTVIAGMTPAGVDPTGATRGVQKTERKIVLQDRPIVGVLFSISHNSLGEIFPLYMGRNIVGRDSNCDICLPEETVSGKHAVIVVRNIPQPKPRLIVSIKDTDSSCGTFINDESIDFDVHLVEDNDRLRIGVAYELLFFKFDPNTMGISASPHFKAVQQQPAQAAAVARGHSTRISSVQAQQPASQQQQPASQQVQQARQQMKEQAMQQINENFNPYAPSQDRERTDRTIISNYNK